MKHDISMLFDVCQISGMRAILVFINRHHSDVLHCLRGFHRQPACIGRPAKRDATAMTDEQTEPQRSVSAEIAMNRVLRAEQEAAHAVSECENEASALIQAARQRAHRISNRTDKRISLINQRIRQKLQQRLAEAERAERRAEAAYERDLRTALVDDVVTGLAAGLTGDGD